MRKIISVAPLRLQDLHKTTKRVECDPLQLFNSYSGRLIKVLHPFRRVNHVVYGVTTINPDNGSFQLDHNMLLYPVSPLSPVHLEMYSIDLRLQACRLSL
jgi:hypothetical protein